MRSPKPQVSILLCALIVSIPLLARGERSSRGLQALYLFSQEKGDTVRDHSGQKLAADLQINDPKAVSRHAGSIDIQRTTSITSISAPSRISDSIKRSGALTFEVWLKPARLDQSGPARIFTLSRDSIQRNFTIGQDGDRFDIRVRTDRTGSNGIPSLQSPPRTLSARPTHLIFTRERSGLACIYINGKRVIQQKIEGSLGNWDSGMHLALGNELTSDRPWLGTYFLAAVYDRALSEREVSANFAAGYEGRSIAPPKQDGTRLFDEKVAAIFANHCLECHDSANKKGKLDLSRKSSALAGGREGPPIIPGKSAESLLWETVASNEMPEDRPPLSDEEKKALRQWIDAGANWTTDFIDPADYAHKTQTDQKFIRRLTLSEYVATVAAITGVDISIEAKQQLPRDMRADGFSNTAYNLNVDLQHVSAYAQLAEIVVDRMDISKFVKQFSANRSLTDKPMRAHITSMGEWILRGPIADNELDAFRGISTTVAGAGGDFDEAMRYILQAMLQSPRFIYHIEDQSGGRPSSHELASRISYVAWGAPPDKALIEASKKGNALGQINRMLDDSRAINRSLQFANDWLHLARLKNLNPNIDRFPNWDPRLAADMRSETTAYFREIVWTQKRPMTDLFNAQVTFATPVLAKHYGLEPNSPTDSIARYDLKEIPSRGGLLTQGSILTIGGDDASMVTRGLFVLHDVLRGTVKDPPPGTDTTPVPAEEGISRREIAIERIKSNSCGGCHKRFEPLAFGLEKFDGIGAFSHTDEHGNKLREDGTVLIPGIPEPEPFKNTAELMDLLAKSDRVAQTITRTVTQFALGRPLTAADRPHIESIHAAAKKGGGTYPSIIKAIVASELVQR